MMNISALLLKPKHHKYAYVLCAVSKMFNSVISKYDFFTVCYFFK